MTFKNKYIALKDNWVLYPNVESNILYKVSLSDSKYFNINGLFGVTLSLLDGTRKYEEYLTLIQDLFSFSSIEAADAFLSNMINHFNKKEEIVAVSENPISIEAKYNSYDFVVNRDDFKQSKRLKSPIRLLIYPTGKCQTNCVYCYADLENLRKRQDMSLEQWKNIFKEASELGIISMDISGGDVFARKDAADFICELIKQNFLFFLSTKCFISEEDALKIANAGFKNEIRGVARDIQLSIDSIEEDVTKFLVGVDNYVNRIEQSASNLIKAGIVPKIKSVISKKNINRIEDLILNFKKLGVVEFNIVKYDDSLYRHNEEFNLSDTEEEDVRVRLGKLANEHKNLILTGNLTMNLDFAEENNGSQVEAKKSKKKLDEATGCSAGRTTFGITPDGRGCLCEQMHMVEPFVFGDLTKQSIIEVWNSKDVINICFPEKEKFENTNCYNCSDFEECVIIKGQCFRDNYFGRNPENKKGNLFSQPNSCYMLN